MPSSENRIEICRNYATTIIIFIFFLCKILQHFFMCQFFLLNCTIFSRRLIVMAVGDLMTGSKTKIIFMYKDAIFFRNTIKNCHMKNNRVNITKDELVNVQSATIAIRKRS